MSRAPMKAMGEKWFTGKVGILSSALLTAVLWGSAFPGIKLAYQYLGIGGRDIFSQLLLAGCRFTAAGLMTMALAFSGGRGMRRLSKRELGEFAVLGFVMTYLTYLFFHVGLANTSGVKGAIWGGLSSVWTILFSHLLTGNDRITGNKLTGCIVGFLGILLLNLGGDLSEFSLLGDGCLLLNTICFGLGSTMSKRVSQGKDPLSVSGWQLLLGGGGLLLTGLLGGGRFEKLGLREAGLIAYLAFASAGGFALWTTLLKYNPSSRIAIYNFLVPLFGALFSALILGEELFNLHNLAALVFVCTGIAVANRGNPEKAHDGNLDHGKIRRKTDE